MRNSRKRIVLRKPWKLIALILCLVGLYSCLVGFSSLKSLFTLSDWDKADFTVLEAYITEQMKTNKVPGLSLVIFQNRKIIYRKGFGVKSADTNEPVDGDTIFQAASFSKTLTAYAAMILVEKGKLFLDQPLNQYLKRKYLRDQKMADRITLRMILNHTSGLSNDSDGKDRQVYFTPGSYFSYSGAGFRYLQQVLEEVTGLPFAEVMEQEIIKPLAMESSSFVFKEEWLPLMASGHEAGIAFPIPKMEVNAAYSLLTTPTDMAKFNMELSQPTLLKPETVALMLTPAVQWKDPIYWGLGIGMIKSPPAEFFWHWGNNYYYCSLMVTSKDSKTGVVIMNNGNTGMVLADNLALKIINEYFPESDRGLTAKIFDLIE